MASVRYRCFECDKRIGFGERHNIDDCIAWQHRFDRWDVRAIIFFLVIVLGALVLAACQTPPTRTETVEVKVPVATHPVAPADVPALPAPLPQRPADARQALDVALAQVCRFVAYAVKADPLLRLSAGLPAEDAPKYPECER
jgi:hypothetical protein